MGGSGGMAGMPDARAMSGIPRPDASVPVGTLSVRLVRGQLSNIIVGHPVDFIASGKTQTIKTDDSGRAVGQGLAPGTLVRAAAVVDGERVESQDFAMPDGAGVLMLLVASDKSAAEQLSKEAVPGTVTLGGQTRIITQWEDETLQVYYLFDFVNATTIAREGGSDRVRASRRGEECDRARGVGPERGGQRRVVRGVRPVRPGRDERAARVLARSGGPRVDSAGVPDRVGAGGRDD